TMDKAKIILSDYMKTMFRVSSLDELPRAKDWIRRLKEGDPLAERQILGQALTNLLVDFSWSMADPDLIENKEPESYAILTPYDITRLFSVMIDSVIAKLPWGNLTHLMVKSLGIITDNLDTGTTPSIQFYLFKSKISPFQAATHE